MDLLETYQAISKPLRGSVLAIGNFDGVHLGHKAVLDQTKTLAQELAKPAGVMMFDPHPKSFFAPEKPFFYLIDRTQKLRRLEAFGLDLAVVLPFDQTLAGLTADDFVKNVLVDGLDVSHVIVGYDFHFGKGREGTPEKLKTLASVHNFEVYIIPQQQQEDGQVYSSTYIRMCLQDGHVAKAAECLGYYWRLRGVVVDGAKRGGFLGFPTANIHLQSGQKLGHGIYAVRIYQNHRCYLGAAYMGKRPTFDNGQPVLEVFLFDFDGDLYGQEIEVEFIEFIRGDVKFDSADALKTQMHQDCAQAKEILEGLEQQRSAV